MYTIQAMIGCSYWDLINDEIKSAVGQWMFNVLDSDTEPFRWANKKTFRSGKNETLLIVDRWVSSRSSKCGIDRDKYPENGTGKHR